MAGAFDSSKAFDSINHNLLLGKLKAYGLSQSALSLMSSYQLGRKQRVCLHSVCSSYSELRAGLPQGSLLGPLLFNIFIYDLNYVVPDMSLRLYADDTTLHASDVSLIALQKTSASLIGKNTVAKPPCQQDCTPKNSQLAAAAGTIKHAEICLRVRNSE